MHTQASYVIISNDTILGGKTVSKRNNNKPTEAHEPWEQSIYDTKDDAGHSRIEKRQYKKGNTVFLTILVFLLLMIIALPIGTFWWVARDKPSENKGGTATTTSSIAASSTQESSAPTSSTPQESSAADPNATPEESVEDPNATPEAETDAVYAEVQAGEGFRQVAERYGVTVEQILELNGLTADAVLHPGDSLRVQ
nr:SAG1386/EF1546 family surface-associated protein [Enterococcus sp. BWR-S5]